MDDSIEISSTRPPLRVALAGAGRSVLLTHLDAFAALPDLYDVTAVCDLDKTRRDRVIASFPKARPYRRCLDMLDDPDIDLVFVALPTADHVPVAMEALERNKWTVVEAPLAASFEKANLLKGAAIRSRGKLLPCLPGYFAPEFRLARRALGDRRIGLAYEAVVRRQDFVRRDDWQSVKRCGGGAAWHTGPEAVQQALTLLGSAPVQLWGELKRVASLGDAEDTVRIALKGRGQMTAYVDIGGGRLDATLPAFEIRGDRGTFAVMPGAKEGVLRTIDPKFRFPRRRCAVTTPPLTDLHENVPILESAVTLPDDEPAARGFWRTVYESVCKAMPFVVTFEEAVETIRYLQVVRMSSPFAK